MQTFIRILLAAIVTLLAYLLIMTLPAAAQEPTPTMMSTSWSATPTAQAAAPTLQPFTPTPTLQPRPTLRPMPTATQPAGEKGCALSVNGCKIWIPLILVTAD